MKIMSNCSQGELRKAAKALKEGHLVAFPTETVYGLGADATNEIAVSRIYSVKARPTDHPLIVHLLSINQLSIWARDIPNFASKLAGNFWPGPMTLILRKNESVKHFITGGQENVGIRIPSNTLALELLREFEKLGGTGVAAPSANRFGGVSPTTAEAVSEELENYMGPSDLILNGGQSEVGIESTIIDCTGDQPVILRPGAVTIEMVEQVAGKVVKFDLSTNSIRASGLLEKHYSPKARVILGKTAQPGDGFIALAKIKTPKGVIRLAAPKTIEEFAKVFYIGLRMADQKGISSVTVHCPENKGLAVAIRDRLNRAVLGK